MTTELVASRSSSGVSSILRLSAQTSSSSEPELIPSASTQTTCEFRNCLIYYSFKQNRETFSELLHMLARTHARTHTQPFNGLWSGTTRIGWYQKKHSPTHTHLDHRTSFINFLHLVWSIASSLFSLRAWQFSLTTSLQVLFGSPRSWALYFILHAFLHPIVIFSQHMPIPSQPVLQ